MKTIGNLLEDHPFFDNIAAETLEFIGGCGKNVKFEQGEYIARMGTPAEWFYLIRHGMVVDEIYSETRGAIQVETFGEGEVVGFSWLFPPHKWQFDIKALELTRAIAFDGKCLRDKCLAEPALGYELMLRFSRIMSSRMSQMRLQLLDMYGGPV